MRPFDKWKTKPGQAPESTLPLGCQIHPEELCRVLADFHQGLLGENMALSRDKVGLEVMPAPAEQGNEGSGILRKRNAPVRYSVNQEERWHPPYQSFVAVPHPTGLLDDCSHVQIVGSGRERQKSA